MKPVVIGCVYSCLFIFTLLIAPFEQAQALDSNDPLNVAANILNINIKTVEASINAAPDINSCYSLCVDVLELDNRDGGNSNSSMIEGRLFDTKFRVGGGDRMVDVTSEYIEALPAAFPDYSIDQGLGGEPESTVSCSCRANGVNLKPLSEDWLKRKEKEKIEKSLQDGDQMLAQYTCAQASITERLAQDNGVFYDIKTIDEVTTINAGQNMGAVGPIVLGHGITAKIEDGRASGIFGVTIAVGKVSTICGIFIPNILDPTASQ